MNGRISLGLQGGELCISLGRAVSATADVFLGYLKTEARQN